MDRKRRFVVGISLVGFLSCACGVWHLYSRELKRLAVPSTHVESSASKAEGDHIKPAIGSVMMPLQGLSMSHKDMTIDLSHRRHRSILFVLSPACPFCRVNLHNWRDIAHTIPLRNIVWADITATADDTYLMRSGIPKDSRVILLKQADANSRRLVVTPTTVVLDSNGAVIWSRIGILAPGDVTQVEKLVTAN
jgi:hypothetical protein